MRTPNYIQSYQARFQRRINRIHRWHLIQEITFNILTAIFLWILILAILSQTPNGGLLV